MSRGVDNIDAMFRVGLIHAFPESCRCRRRNGDAALLLLLHPVHDRVAIMHFAQLVGKTSVKQHSLGGRGLTCIDVGHDADIAIPFDWS